MPDGLAGLLAEYRQLRRREAELDRDLASFKKRLAAAIGDEDRVLGYADNGRYYAKHMVRDNRKPDLAALSKIALERGAQEEAFVPMLTEDSAAQLMEAGVLTEEDLKGALVGKMSEFVQVFFAKESEEDATIPAQSTF